MQGNLKTKIESVLNDKIIKQISVAGGCINNAEVVITEGGNNYFIKSNSNSAKDMFLKEASGLRELEKANAIRVPKVIHIGSNFLILENISQNTKSNTFWKDFGRAFAKLHRITSGSFGFYEDNYIGSSQQKNIANIVESKNWTEFFFTKRILFQYKLAETNGHVDRQLKDAFLQFESKIELIFKDLIIVPSLLHGDLWSGNYITDEKGNACLIDPAVYYGHREADLAMTKLFGGFDSMFYSAYNEEYPLEDGYDYRENIYKLYHVLNHLNLFGKGYYNQAISLIKFYL